MFLDKNSGNARPCIVYFIIYISLMSTKYTSHQIQRRISIRGCYFDTIGKCFGNTYVKEGYERFDIKCLAPLRSCKVEYTFHLHEVPYHLHERMYIKDI